MKWYGIIGSSDKGIVDTSIKAENICQVLQWLHDRLIKEKGDLNNLHIEVDVDRIIDEGDSR